MKNTSERIGVKQNIVLIFVCIVINLLGKLIAQGFNLPLWLDAVGTCVAAYFAGPVGAVMAGAFGNLLFYFIEHSALVYMIVNIAVGLICCFCVKRGYLDKLTTAVMSSFLIGVFAVVLSTPLNMYFYGGKTGNFWSDTFYDMLEWYGFSPVICSLGAEAIIDIIDKQISVFIAFWIIRVLLKYGKKRFGTLLQSVTAVVLASAVFGTSLVVDAQELSYDDNFVNTIYDSRSGMPASAANDIAETDDGYIWIGSYAGLTRFNGREFEFIHESGISSVTSLMTDSSGRLWIGTNDSGIAMYTDNNFVSVASEDGLPANSIRCFVEAEDGSIYAGTTGNLCKLKVDENGNIQIDIIENEITYVTSICTYNGNVIGTTNTGKLFVLHEDQIEYVIEPEDKTQYYSCVAVINHKLWAGTAGGYLEQFDWDMNRVVMEQRIETDGFNNITEIKEDSEQRVWICSDNGIGYMPPDDDGQQIVKKMKIENFDASIECMHEDYEGNIWFASSRYGVMKLSQSKFLNLFEEAGINSSVVNAVLLDKGNYYCGTDNGLVILNADDVSTVNNKLTELVKGTRVRCIMADSQENLWICTYGDAGLVRYSPDGSITKFNEQSKNTINNRFRCIIELSDGSMAAGSSDGINFIKDDEVVGTITTEDGLDNSQILYMCEDKSGRLYAATDGAGIYVIENQKIVKHIGAEEGLPSDVVLRMTPYKDGYFVIASNSLCYMENDTIRPINRFPYFDNYDVMVSGDLVYVLSSAGIYRVNGDQLISEGDVKYRLFNHTDGLSAGLTVNAWNMFDEDGRLFVCTNRGVIYFKPDDMENKNSSFKSSVSVVLNDGKTLEDEEGVFVIPQNTKTFTVKAAVMKYSLSEVKTRFFIGGIDDNEKVILSSEIEPIQISNLNPGRYLVHLQILSDDESEILQEKVYLLKKEAHTWENAWYIAYLVFIVLWMITFAIWVVLTLLNILKQRQQLEQLRRQLEEKVREQTEEIRVQAEKMEDFQWEVIESLASLIESRDWNTGDHVKNTSKYVAVIANEMLRMHLHPDIITEKYVDILIKVAPLHDVGKIKISDVILNKPGKFTPEEYEIMKNHAACGGEIVESILGRNADTQMVQIAKDIARYHHEKWDGTGYPEGKKGENIPLAARIMAVADVFDALVSRRVYKDPFSVEDAFEIIKEEAGKQFDEEIVNVFMKMKPEIIKQLKLKQLRENMEPRQSRM